MDPDDKKITRDTTQYETMDDAIKAATRVMARCVSGDGFVDALGSAFYEIVQEHLSRVKVWTGQETPPVKG